LINHKNAVARKLFKELDTCVDGTTRTAFEAARFFKYFVTKLMAEGKDVPMIDEAYLYCVFTAIAEAKWASTIATLFGKALKDYEHLRPAGMERVDLVYERYMILYAAWEYLTACKKHVVLNLVKRIEKALMRVSTPWIKVHGEEPEKVVVLLSEADDSDRVFCQRGGNDLG
jgi:hypothetical protein